MFARILLVALLAGFTLPAAAADVSEKTGVGVERALGFQTPPGSFAAGSGGVVEMFPAFSLVIPTTDIFHFQVLSGLAFAAGAGAGPTFGLGAALRGLYHGIPLSETVDLVMIFGLGAVFITHEDFAGQVSDVFIHLETGLRPEWFITDYLSIHTQAGVVLSLLALNNATNFDPGVSLSVFDNVNLIGDAGFTVWF